MPRRTRWFGAGALVVMAIAAGLLVWRPWRIPYGNQTACTFYRENPGPGQAMCITWAQAKRRYPSWVRQPTWLPSTVQWQELTVNRPIHHIALPPPGLTVLYQMPHGAEIQVQENPTVIDGAGGPRTRTRRLDGQLVYVSAWTSSSNPPTHLKVLYFDSDRHWYLVMSFNTPWADVDRVAASLMR